MKLPQTTTIAIFFMLLMFIIGLIVGGFGEYVKLKVSKTDPDAQVFVPSQGIVVAAFGLAGLMIPLLAFGLDLPQGMLKRKSE